MNLIDAIDIAASGMSAQRIRMNVISSNLANVRTTRTPEGGPYKRKDVIFAALPLNSFDAEFKGFLTEPLYKVEAINIMEDTSEPRYEYDPSHPDANKEGYVAYPNISLSEEMVNMISASRSFEANLAIVQSAKNMAQQAIDIIR